MWAVTVVLFVSVVEVGKSRNVCTRELFERETFGLIESVKLLCEITTKKKCDFEASDIFFYSPSKAGGPASINKKNRKNLCQALQTLFVDRF